MKRPSFKTSAITVAIATCLAGSFVAGRASARNLKLTRAVQDLNQSWALVKPYANRTRMYGGHFHKAMHLIRNARRQLILGERHAAKVRHHLGEKRAAERRREER